MAVAISDNLDLAVFRMRGRDVLRVEALSDVVFGFALTLLVVSLQVPRTFDQMIDAMEEFPSFAITFFLLTAVWRTHYYFFRRYGLHDSRTIMLNTILLFVILFYVYPLKFLFTFNLAPLTGASVGDGGRSVVPPIRPSQVPALMTIFGLGFFAVYVLFVLMFQNAYRMRTALKLNAVEAFDTRVAILRNSILAVTAVVATAIALVLPVRIAGHAGWMYATIPISLYLLHRLAAGRRRDVVGSMMQGD